ncbi:MAG: hypothetical protein QXI37_01965, partial [Thermoprotei archaeon]
MSLRSLVEGKLNVSTKCYGHCDSAAKLKFLKAKELTGAVACEKGYVSRIVRYSDKPVDVNDFVTYISAVFPGNDVKPEDIRTATRHPWDMGLEDGGYGSKEALLHQAYWTQNYRRTKNESADRPALFLCQGCESLYVQPVSAQSSLCPSCSSK